MVVGEYFSQPKDWLSALKANDVNKATQIFNSAAPAFKDFLLNGVILCYNRNKMDGTDHFMNAKGNMRFCITKPLHAAAIYHSNDIIRFLYVSGIDLFQVDDWQNNVFHKLVQAASLDIIHEKRYGETLVYIRDLLTDVEVKRLLLAENSFSLRPLEFAAFHGCLGLTWRILETRGVYLFKETHIGYNVIQYFDMSDYEMFGENIPPRLYCSPMIFLMYMETSRIQNYHAINSINEVVSNESINAKISMNWPFICIWFLFRVLYTGLFFAAALDKEWSILPSVINETSNSTETTKMCVSHEVQEGMGLWYILTTLSAMILIHDLWEYIWFRRRFSPEVYAAMSKRNVVTHASFFTKTQVITYFSMIGITCCQILRQKGTDIPITLDHTFFILISFCCMWSLLYFFQVVPWMSIYAIAVQRMLEDFVRFTIIFSLFFTVFALSFHRVLSNNTDSCPKHFETAIEAAYSTFLAMLNLIDFRSYENVDRISIYVLHITYVLFVAILLLNFLIGLMSRSFSEVYAQRHWVIKMQRLSLVGSLQLRLAWPMRAIYRKLQTRVFECHGRQLLIKRVTVQDKEFDETW